MSTMENIDYDTIVVGGGLGGMSAANTVMEWGGKARRERMWPNPKTTGFINSTGACQK